MIHISLYISLFGCSWGQGGGGGMGMRDILLLRCALDLHRILPVNDNTVEVHKRIQLQETLYTIFPLASSELVFDHFNSHHRLQQCIK